MSTPTLEIALLIFVLLTAEVKNTTIFPGTEEMIVLFGWLAGWLVAMEGLEERSGRNSDKIIQSTRGKCHPFPLSTY